MLGSGILGRRATCTESWQQQQQQQHRLLEGLKPAVLKLMLDTEYLVINPQKTVAGGWPESCLLQPARDQDPEVAADMIQPILANWQAVELAIRESR